MSDENEPQPQPCQGHLVQCQRCRMDPGFEPGRGLDACTSCNGVGSVLLK